MDERSEQSADGPDGDDDRHTRRWSIIGQQAERRFNILPVLVVVTTVVFVIWVAVNTQRELKKSEERFGTVVSPTGRLVVGQSLQAKVSDQFEAKITVGAVAHHNEPYSYLSRSSSPGWVVVEVTVEMISGELPFHGEYFELEERDGTRHGPLNITGPTPPEAFEPLFPKTVSKAPDTGSGNLVFWQVGHGGYTISFPAVPDAYWSYEPSSSAAGEATGSGGVLRPGEVMIIDNAGVEGAPVVAFVQITAIRAIDGPGQPGNGSWVAADFIVGSDRGIVKIADVGLENASGQKYAPAFWSLSAGPAAWPGSFDVSAGQMTRGTFVFDAPPGSHRVVVATPAATASWQG